MLLKFETRCGCTKEFQIPGMFRPPPVYLFLLKTRLKATTYKSHEPLDIPPDIPTRTFRLMKVEHGGSNYPTAYYEEES